MDYNSLKKFNQLPPALKARFSTPETIATIDELEQKYRLKLAMVFIALVVNDLDSSDLENYLLGALGASPEAANDISRVFLSLLGQTAVPRPLAEVAPKPAFGLPPAKPAMADGAKPVSLTFSTEDEAEVDHYRPLVNGYKKQSYETIAQGIVAEIGYQLMIWCWPSGWKISLWRGLNKCVMILRLWKFYSATLRWVVWDLAKNRRSRY